MKIVISPAKALNYDSGLPTARHSHPCFLEEAVRLNKLLKGKSPKKLSELMGISANLADLNWQRNQDFRMPFTPENARPALYAFNGDVYTGLQAYTIPEEKLERLQDTLRILSGLYGILKPLDLIQPYRLEMGSRLRTRRGETLYAFWGDQVAQVLREDAAAIGTDLLLNCASQEYFGAVDLKALKIDVVTPNFFEVRNGTPKMVSFFAKKARGAMARFIVDRKVTSVEGLKDFDYGGYRFAEETDGGSGLTFLREAEGQDAAA